MSLVEKEKSSEAVVNNESSNSHAGGAGEKSLKTTKKADVRKDKKVKYDESVLVVARNKMIKSSVTKLNLVAEMIRGLKASKAVSALTFCNKKVAYDVKKVVMSGVANAENNYNLDIDSLYVKEAYVGKAMTLKRFSARAKGRGNRLLKEFSKITVVLCAGE